MDRKQLKFLRNWLNRPNRKPIILRGARQVGKSTLIRLFAQEIERPLAEINLERYPELASAFDRLRPERLVDLFEALPGINAITPETLVFLDEIQAIPTAIPKLRYFYEDLSNMPLIAAGSLLEFALSDHQFSMPVGRVEYLHMGPMTFTEFLDALDETRLAGIIRSFELNDVIEPVVHQRLLELLRTYCFVGGMPEAVQTYVDSRRLSHVSLVHNAIIETWREDFPKYIGSRNLSRMQHVFNFAARNVGKKVKYSLYSGEHKSATIKTDIELLCMARVLSKVIHSHANGLPLQAEIEDKIYKLIFLDVGLMNTICGLSWREMGQWTDVQLVNEGAIAEQFIGQHLQDMLAMSPNRELTYWLREGRSNNAEIDFVVAISGHILPIEVKAGATGSLKSLHQFVAEKRVTTAVRFDTGLPSQQGVKTRVRRGNNMTDLDYRLISLPLYLVERLPDLNL